MSCFGYYSYLGRRRNMIDGVGGTRLIGSRGLFIRLGGMGGGLIIRDVFEGRGGSCIIRLECFVLVGL